MFVECKFTFTIKQVKFKLMKFKPKINVKLLAENYGTESTL